MTVTQVTGQYILDEVKTRLGALANAFTVDQLVSFANDGVHETWSVLRSLDLDYFGDSSEDTDTTQDEYFADLSPTVREYNLPANCREVRFLECLSTGFEDRVFEYRKFEDIVFQTARRESTSLGPDVEGDSGAILGRYYYTVFGTQLILAQYPETVGMKLKIWYIKSLNDITDLSVPLPDILYPFSRKIIDYTVTKLMLASQNQMLAAEWLEDWKESIKTLALTAGSRSSSNPIFIADYTGE